MLFTFLWDLYLVVVISFLFLFVGFSFVCNGVLMCLLSVMIRCGGDARVSKGFTCLLCFWFFVGFVFVMCLGRSLFCMSVYVFLYLCFFVSVLFYYFFVMCFYLECVLIF